MTAARPDLRATLVALLVRRGHRLTAPRRQVLDALLAGGAPLTAAEIHRRLERSANLASVYRTLHLLRRLGALRVTDSTNGEQRFELADRFTQHHHHLICRECGRIEDLDGCLLDARVLQALNRRVRQSRRFRVTEHELRLIGACRDCDGRR
jgi:Fur family ferric uptake transcriptional regulator